MNRLRLVPISAAVGAVALMISSAPALAAGTYTVKAGTATTGTTNYSAATQGASPQIKFNDVTTGVALGCASGTAAGTVKLGNAVNGTALGRIASTTWTGCTGPLGLQLSVTQNQPWNINATGTTTAAGVTAGTVTAIKATVVDTSSGGAQCKFVVSGSVRGNVKTTATVQTLQIVTAGANLRISQVTGCFGQVNNNDRANFAATYKINAAKGKLSVKSN